MLPGCPTDADNTARKQLESFFAVTMEKTMENFWPEIAAADARWLDRHHGLGLIRFAIITVGQSGSIRFILWRGAFRHNPAQIDKGL